MGEQRSPSRWWALAALLPMGVFLVVGAVAPSSSYLTRLYFAGDPGRWRFAAFGLADADASRSVDAVFDEARFSILLDLAFASSFAVVGFFLLRAGHRHWAPERRSPVRGGRWIWRHMPLIAVGAGVLDLIETTGQLIWLDEAFPPTVATHLIAVVAWWKWALYLVALVGLFGLVLGPIAAPIVRPRMIRLLGDRPFPRTAQHVPCVHGIDENGDCCHDPAAGDVVERPEQDEVLGITASGGGIRSASVMIGIFRGLTATGTFQRARYLHAVSGGGFAAGGWQASSHVRTTEGVPDLELFGSDHPWFGSVRQRLRYLDNGPGSILAGAASVALRTVIVLGSVISAAVLAGWLVGWLAQTWAVVPGFSNADGDPTPFAAFTAMRLVLPGAIPVGLATLVFVAGFATGDPERRSHVRNVAVALGALGVTLLTLLFVIPISIRSGRVVLSLFREGSAETNVTILGVVSGAGLAGAVWKMLQAEIKKRWSRLGGVFLLVGLLALAGKVADDRANVDRLFRGVWVPIAALVWLIVTDWLPSHRLTLNGIYRQRLAGTFVLGTDTVDLPPAGARTEPATLLRPLGDDDEPEWSAYEFAAGPELVLCGTAQSTELQHGGLQALGFAFGANSISLFDDHDGQPTGPYEPGSSWEGYPRRWTVSRSMALAGAAFSSAMGRQSYGSTNALLAAVNLRLGMWVPNPNRRTWFREAHPAPRVHLGYFLKELTGRYDPDDDAFVYVTDGGHRDNLGFVEQLRKRPDRMIVLDASGDSPGGFGTFRQAIELADVELGAQVDVEWDPIEWREHDVPRDCVTKALAQFRDRSGDVTRIIYAKAQISDTASLSLRQFAASDPTFPDYSTGDQFLTSDQFDRLVELGEHIAERIATFVS